jgi:hypothetical protein
MMAQRDAEAGRRPARRRTLGKSDAVAFIYVAVGLLWNLGAKEGDIQMVAFVG